MIELIFGIIVTIILVGNIILQKKLDRMDRNHSEENYIDVEYEILTIKKIGFFKRKYNKLKNFIYHNLYVQ